MHLDAFSLLFKNNFGGKPLFRSQVDFVKELLTEPSSEFYSDQRNEEEYKRAFGRTKTFVSQLFSEHSRRCISQGFSKSLEVILEKKSQQLNFDVVSVFQQIVDDLKGRNVVQKNRTAHIRREEEKHGELAGNIMEADVITILTAREINLELCWEDKKMSIQEVLIHSLFDALQNRRNTKSFRFNFPLKETCGLFWKWLRMEVTEHLYNNPICLSPILVLLHDTGAIWHDEKEITTIASALLRHCCRNKIVNVYWLKAPVYFTSVLALQSKRQNTQITYLFLKNDGGEEQAYRMSSQEIALSRLFVWDNLSMAGYGIPVEYDADRRDLLQSIVPETEYLPPS